MGDVVGLVEKAQAVFDQKQAAELERKISEEGLTLDDYLEQLQSMKKMGSMKGLLEMLPGLAGQVDEDKIDEAGMKREESMLRSMTRK